VIGKGSAVKISVSLKSATEVILKNIGGNNFLTLLSLRAGLSVVFAHVGIVCSDETNDALLALVTNIDTYKHCLVGNLLAEVHSPEISSQFGIDLSHNVEIDAIVVTINSLSSDEL